MGMRLIVLHHAGGTHLMYHGWAKLFPPDWRVTTPSMPGRQMDGREPFTDAEQLVDHLLHELDGELTGRFALFGHSMGAMLAYRLTRRLLSEGRTPPVWLGVSGRGAPQPDGGTPALHHRLDDGALRRQLAEMGATPRDVLDDPELWTLFQPIIRADLALTETLPPEPDVQPLPVPLSVFGGRADRAVPPTALEGWAGVSPHFLGLHLYAGDHFYFLPDPARVVRQIVADVRKSLAVPGAAR